MNTFISKSLVVGITVLVAAVILLWSFSKAYNSGKLTAQSVLIAQNVAALSQGLEYFYNDQNRYPSSEEFIASGQSPLNLYFNIFPAKEFPFQSCQTTYQYKRPAQQTYELNVCLPKEAGGLMAGWNRLIKNR